MLALQEYASSSDDENSFVEKVEDSEPESKSEGSDHLKPVENAEFSIKSQLQICAAPLVVPTVSSKYCVILLRKLDLK